jgi:PAS domain S-box-containing protein
VISPLRILHLEDDPKDAELVQATLEAEGVACHVARAENQRAFLTLFEQGEFNLILADHTLPSFDGISALKITKEVCPEVPFIFVSGTLGEETAIEALKMGATDYVLKTRLSRLVPSVQRALREAEQSTQRKRAEEALRRNEAYLAEAQRLSHTGSFGWRVSSGEIYWSEETFRIFEVEFATKPTLERILQRTHPEDRDFVRQIIDSISQERNAFDFQHRLLMPDGSVKYVRVVGHPSTSGESGDFEFVGAVTDISERKRAEEALRQTESFLAEAQRLSHTGSWAWRVQGRDALHLSEEWYRIYGFDPEEGMPNWEKQLQRIHPEDRAKWQGAIERAIGEKSDYDVEFRILLPDGSVKHIHSVGHPVLDASGDLVQFVGGSTDVTERRRTEEALRRSESYLAEAQKLTNTGSYAWCVASGEIIYWSQEIYRLFGFDPKKGIPPFETFRQRIHPDDQARAADVLERTIRDKVPYEILFRAVLPDGRLKYIHSVGHPVFNPSGEVVEVVGTNMDVTERQQAEEALRRSEQRLRDVIETIPTMAWTALPDGANDFANQRWLEYTGKDRENTSGAGWKTAFHPADIATHVEKWHMSLTTGKPFENEARLRRTGNGEYRWFLHRAVPLRDELGNIVKWYGTATDIEDRKRAEEALRRSEGYLAEAQKLTRSGSWAWNVRRGAIFWSREVFRIYECDPEKINPTWSYILERIHPEDRAGIEQRAKMEASQKERVDSEGDFRIVLPDGKIKHLHSIAHPVIDESGEITEVVGTVMDVTERKLAEEARERLRQAQADLAHVTRVTTMGELTASLAHEIKQPITAAATNAKTCLRWLGHDQPDVAEAREAASRIIKDVTRASDIISRIRSLFKKGAPQRESLDVNEVIEEMIALLRNEASRYSILISSDLADNLPKIMADHVQLQQVFMNLMLNGIEAMTDAQRPGKLTVKSQQAENGQILISISDTGAGLPAEQADQIFNAFFTTKPQGTGMGLAISRSIIESHGGRLWVSATCGSGATFHFTLPSEVETHILMRGLSEHLGHS